MAQTKIETEQLADNAVSTASIAGDAVTTAKIADDVGLGGSPTTTTQSSSDNTTKVATTAYVTTAIANLIDSAPGTMNTLNEIAAALNDDANFNTTVTNSIAAKMPLAGGTFTGDVTFQSASNSLAFFISTDANANIRISDSNSTSTSHVGIGAVGDDLTLIAGNDNRLRITSAGKVGIGTTAPQDMHDNADELVIYSGGNAGITILTATNQAGQIYFADGAAGDAAYRGYIQYDHGGERLYLGSGGAARVTVMAAGNVGIGETTPLDSLSISSSAGNAAIRLKRTDTSIVNDDIYGAINFAGDDSDTNASGIRGFIRGRAQGTGGGMKMEFHTAGGGAALVSDPRMTLDADGKVGVGTTSPNNPLDIEHTGSANQAGIRIIDSASQTWNWLTEGTASNLTAGEHLIHIFGKEQADRNSAHIGFTYNSDHGDDNTLNLGFHSVNDILNITGGGKVGIGTSSPASKLTIFDGTSAIGLAEYQSGAVIWLDGSNGDFSGGDYWGVHAIDATNFAIGYAGGRAFNITSAGKVGIGLTSAASYFSPELVVSAPNTGGITIAASATSATNYLMFADGTTGNEAYRGYVVYGHTNDVMAFATAGATRVTILSTGSVGIGTAAPSVPLQVNGNIALGSNAAAGTAGRLYFEMYNSNDSAFVHGGEITVSGTAFNSDATSDSDMTIKVMQNKAQVTAMTIKNTGNVGIGTTAPDTPLHIQTNDSTTNALVNSLMITNLSTGTTTTGFGGEIRFQAERNNGVNQNTGRIASVAEVNSGSDISSGLSFWTGSVGVLNERIRIAHGGNVGIGTTTPSAPLHVNGNSYLIAGSHGIEGNADSANYLINSTSGILDIKWFGGVRFLTNGSSERARVTSNGLTFNGDTAAANALDDYEEGTFTPTWSLSGGGSVTNSGNTVNEGRYTKVGRLCTVSWYSYIVQTTGTITQYIMNLPFTAATNAFATGAAEEFGQTGSGLNLLIVGGGTAVVMDLYSGATFTAANSYMRGSITYQTA